MGGDPTIWDLRLAPRLAASPRKWASAAPFLLLWGAGAGAMLLGRSGHPVLTFFGAVAFAWGWLLAATAVAREAFEELRGNRLLPWTRAVHFSWSRKWAWIPVVGSLGVLGSLAAAGVAVGALPRSWDGVVGWFAAFGLAPALLAGGCAAAAVVVGFALVLVLGPAIAATTGEGWVEVLGQVLALCLRRPVSSFFTVCMTLCIGAGVFGVDVLVGTVWVSAVLDPGHLPTAAALLSFAGPGSTAAAGGAAQIVRILAVFHATATVSVSAVIAYLALRRHLDGVRLLDRADLAATVHRVPHAGDHVTPSSVSES